MKKFILAFIFGIAYLTLIFAGKWEITTHESEDYGPNYTYTQIQPLSGSLLKNNTDCIIKVTDSNLWPTGKFSIKFPTNIVKTNSNLTDFSAVRAILSNDTITKETSCIIRVYSDSVIIEEFLPTLAIVFKGLKEVNIFIEGKDWTLETKIDKIPIIRDQNYPYFISNDGKCFRGIRIWELAETTSLIIPDSITKIESVGHCTEVEHITIPKSVRKIDNAAFSSCWSLKSISIPDGIEISKGAFDGCKSLKTLETNSKFWHIEDVFLMDGDSIVSLLDKSLEKYTLPKNIQKEDFEFVISSCYYNDITELVISSPTKIENIDYSDETCNTCLKNLKKITVPKSVKLSHFPTTVQIIRK